jgi:hypothetical protein
MSRLDEHGAREKVVAGTTAAGIPISRSNRSRIPHWIAAEPNGDRLAIAGYELRESRLL